MVESSENYAPAPNSSGQDQTPPNPTFSVDTHLFRELGELLVGRDSTALVELIKNAYDADATMVEVHGVNLDAPDQGQITITDNGIGMNEAQFRQGFLRVASRFKSDGAHRSPRFGRRYTGAKGVGRLAAHKLGRYMTVDSVPGHDISEDTRPIQAIIDWDEVEALQTLDEVAHSTAIKLTVDEPLKSVQSGTTISLTRLRRKWTDKERARFFAEVNSFTPPKPLLKLPDTVLAETLLFDEPKVRDIVQPQQNAKQGIPSNTKNQSTKQQDTGFSIQLRGELEAGEDLWIQLAEASQWVIEIDASRPENDQLPVVRYGIAPTNLGQTRFPEAKGRVFRFQIDRTDSALNLYFQCRILIREAGEANISRAWTSRSSGVRVFMEGFRVLPYGEVANDWLQIDFDYTQRLKTLPYLRNLNMDIEERDNEGLTLLRTTSYFGAVFLTADDAPDLRMLVNREGFVPDAAYDELVKIVRIGIDLSTRVRASTRVESSKQRGETRREHMREEIRQETAQELRAQVSLAVQRASESAAEARHRAAAGDVAGAVTLIDKASREFELASETSNRLMTEGSVLRILASVGAQMSAFVHEINALLGTAMAVETAFEDLSNDKALDSKTRQRLRVIHRSLGDLRRSIERQASYLVDVVSPDARRRRSRQNLSERFEAARRLVEPTIIRRKITVYNDLSADLRTPPMFPAEITVVFSNLLTNAVKAAGEGGQIRAWGETGKAGTRLLIENTGIAVQSDEGERWFSPFESTTTSIDPLLGQGMGMGLPITRNLLSEYGATIQFAKPSPGYATALEVVFPS